MELSDVYQNKVTKNPVNNLSFGFNAPNIQRDPTIMNLEKEVFSKMLDLMPKEEIKKPTVNNIKQFSLEDAIKELQSMKNV